MFHGNREKSDFWIGQNFPEWLFVASSCPNKIHLEIQNYLDSGISVGN